MARIYTFDNPTATRMAREHLDHEVVLAEGDAVATALANERDGVVLLPAAKKDRALVVEIRRPAASNAAMSPSIPAQDQTNYQASGFLGLSDELVLDDQPQKKNKKP